MNEPKIQNTDHRPADDGRAATDRSSSANLNGGFLTRVGRFFRHPNWGRIVLSLAMSLSVLVPLWQPLLLALGWLSFTLMAMFGLPFLRTRRTLTLAFVAASLAYVIALIVGELVLVAALHAICLAALSALPILAALAVAGALTVPLYRKFNPQRRLLRMSMLWGATGLLCGFFLYANTQDWMVQWQMCQALSIENLNQLPITGNDRLVPRQTALEFIQNANRDNRLTVPAPHLVHTDDNLFWQSALQYKVWYGTMLGSVSRIVRIDADRTEMHADTKTGEKAEFVFGDQSWVVENTMKLRHPLSTLGETVYWHHQDGSWSLLISYLSKRPTLAGTMVPYLAGVMEVSQYGWFRDYSARQAAQLFHGAPLYPPSLARQYTEAYANWRGGLLTRTVGQADILEVSEESNPSSTANLFPYLQHIQGLGLQEVIQLEPRGNSSYALVEVLYFDAATGQVRRYMVPEHTILNGARKAIENVRKADPNADWSHRRELEPRLVVTPNGNVFQLISVVQNSPENPNSYAYIMSVLVNAADLSATRIDNAQQLEDFLKRPLPSPAATQQ